LSALNKLPRGTKARGAAKPKTKEHSMLTNVFQSYSEHSYAVIFACNKYPKEKSLIHLDCAVADGKLIEKTLKAHGFKILGTHYDEECNKANIEKELVNLMSKFPYDKKLVGRLYLMFAGHGLKDKISGSSVFCCHDYNHEAGVAYSTSYPLSELKAKIQRIGIKHITLHFDCCHAGGIFLANRARQVDFVAETMANKPSVSAITSVTADEKALERGGNGLFTKSVCKWLDPEKRFVFDRFDSDYVTMSQLFGSVVEEVTTEARESGGQMTPLKKDIQQQHMDEQCAGEMLFFAPKAWEAYHQTRAPTKSVAHDARGRGSSTMKETATRDETQVEEEDEEMRALRKQLEAAQKKEALEKKKLEMKQQLEAVKFEEEENKRKEEEEKKKCKEEEEKRRELLATKIAALEQKHGVDFKASNVDLKKKNLNDEDAVIIGAMLKINKNITCLTLERNNISDVGVKSIMEGLTSNQKLVQIWFTKNKRISSNVKSQLKKIDKKNGKLFRVIV
jgi:hypothetical protein